MATFRWIDRSAAVRWASYEYRTARDLDGKPIHLSEACGRAIGYGDETGMVGRFCTTPAIGDARWARFEADVAKDIDRVDHLNKFLRDEKKRKLGS